MNDELPRHMDLQFNQRLSVLVYGYVFLSRRKRTIEVLAVENVERNRRGLKLHKLSVLSRPAEAATGLACHSNIRQQGYWTSRS